MKTKLILSALLLSALSISCKKAVNGHFTISDNYDDHYIEINEELECFCSYPDNKIDFTWDFGDGTIIENSGCYMSHSYTSPGDYKLKLTASHGSNTSDYERTIRVTNYGYRYVGTYTGLSINNSSCSQETVSTNLHISSNLTSDTINVINLSNEIGYSFEIEVAAANVFTIAGPIQVTFSDQTQWDLMSLTGTWTEQSKELWISVTYSDAAYANSCGTMTSMMLLSRVN